MDPSLDCQFLPERQWTLSEKAKENQRQINAQKKAKMDKRQINEHKAGKGSF